MAEHKERLIELMLEETLGKAPPDLTGRVMRAIELPVVHTRLEPERNLFQYWPWAAAAAALFVIAVALLMKVGQSAPDAPPEPSIAGPESNVQPAPSFRDRADQTDVPPGTRPHLPVTPGSSNAEKDVPPSSPEPAPPAPANEGAAVPQDPSPGRTPDPSPESPVIPEVVDGPAQPAKRDDVAPPPSVPAIPEPPPPLPPGPTVKNPGEPEPVPAQLPERPPTEAQPAMPARVATISWAASNAELRYRLPGQSRWTELRDVEARTALELLPGVTLRARHPVSLDMGAGITAWFRGDVTLGRHEELASLDIDDAVFVDAAGSKGGILLRRGDVSIEVADATVLAEKFASNLKVACLEGELNWGESKLVSGQSATLSGRGFSRERNEGSRLRDDRLIQYVARVQNLWREDFDAKIGDRLYAGEVEGGRVVGAARDLDVGLHLSGSHAIKGPAFLRIRMKAATKTHVVVQLLAEEGKARFQREVALEAGQWTVIRLPVKPVEGTAATVVARFQATAKAKGAHLEIDWIEIGEEPADR